MKWQRQDTSMSWVYKAEPDRRGRTEVPTSMPSSNALLRTATHLRSVAPHIMSFGSVSQHEHGGTVGMLWPCICVKPALIIRGKLKYKEALPSARTPHCGCSFCSPHATPGEDAIDVAAQSCLITHHLWGHTTI